MNTYQYVAHINHKDDEVRTLHQYKEHFSIVAKVTVEFDEGRRFTGKVHANNEQEAKKLILEYLLSRY